MAPLLLLLLLLLLPFGSGGVCAATAALAPPPIGAGPLAGAPLAATIRTFGYASAALQGGLAIGQAAASFEGGGLTPSGPRSGGIDGRGGFAAILHPNEKVTDLTKQSSEGSGPIEVVTNVTVIGGNENADVRTSSTMLNDRKAIVNVVVDQLSNPSSPGFRALQSTSNVSPRGSI